MRKKFVAITLFICIALPAFVIAQSKFAIGAKAGISIPNLRAPTNDPVSKGWSSNLGPYLGVVSSYDINERFSIQAEFNYSTQGGKKYGKQVLPNFLSSGASPDTPYLYGHFNAEATIKYFELPVMVRYNITLNKPINLIVMGGPYIAYLLKANSLTSGSSALFYDEKETHPATRVIDFSDDMDIKPQLKKINAGIQGSIGISHSVSHGLFMLVVGGNYGLIHVQKDAGNGKNNTGSVNATLGYLFHF